MSKDADFDGDRCVVLPANYLQSVTAATEIYEDELARVSMNLDVESFSGPGFFSGTLTAAVLWALPSLWMACY